jgi:hypothetical protein
MEGQGRDNPHVYVAECPSVFSFVLLLVNEHVGVMPKLFQQLELIDKNVRVRMLNDSQEILQRQISLEYNASLIVNVGIRSVFRHMHKEVRRNQFSIGEYERLVNERECAWEITWLFA